MPGLVVSRWLVHTKVLESGLRGSEQPALVSLFHMQPFWLQDMSGRCRVRLRVLQARWCVVGVLVQGVIADLGRGIIFR